MCSPGWLLDVEEAFEKSRNSKEVLGIRNQSSVVMTLRTHRKRNHRQAPYNVLEEAVEEQRSNRIILTGDDVVLWKKKGIRSGQILIPERHGS